MKQCIKCLEIKDLNKFEKQRNQCKVCRNASKKPQTKSFEVNVKEKLCITCNTVKVATDFNIHKRHSDGLTSKCKNCRTIISKRYYEKNKEQIKEKSCEYYKKVRHTEEFKKSRITRYKRKMNEDPLYVLSRRLRNRLYYALEKKSWKKNTKFSEYIGCTLEELKAHLEKQFKPGMSWDNRKEWHIDHIIPLDSSMSEEELYKLSHYTNLQPLWAKENIIKGNKIK